MLIKKQITYSLLILIITSCSTKKNTFTSRSYHNVTSRYNIYFNGREAFKAGYKRIEDNFEEPYNDILPVFYYKKKGALAQASGDMDRAILKCTKLIKNHSITAKPQQKGTATTEKQIAFYNKKEYNKWIDDSYLLMGNALFYQEKYYDAQKNFEYVINEYKTDEIRFDAYISLARTKTELGLFDDAKEILEKCKENNEFPDRLIADLYATYADVFIQEKKYDDAIAMLQIATKHTKRKKIKVRYTYILAQLYQEINDNSKAIEYYKKVEDLNPDYEMAFNAKISQATAFDSGTGSSAEIKKLLKKLLDDDKNKEYKDQIYYALANIYYEENDEEKALELYLKSLEYSSSNTHQKAMSYLAIGEIYLAKRKYLAAQPYVDSCLAILPEDYRNYNQLKITNENLNALAFEHNTVSREDSLQKVAKMSDAERNDYIDEIIATVREKEEEERIRKEEAQQNSTLYNQEFGANNNKLSGKWYFYNESAVTFGKAEFIKRWGERQLEDDWRRTNKTKISWNVVEDETNETVDTAIVEERPQLTNTKSRSYYMRDLPLTDSALKVSTEKIEHSLFKEGMIYRNSIGDNQLAIETLEKFIERFPNSEYAPIALYYLHIICSDERDFTKATKYKDEVITRFPKSNYAKALTNPSFFKDLKKQNKQIEKNYSNCYKAFSRNDLKAVISIAQNNINENPDSYLLPKFTFLQSLAYGKLLGIERLKLEISNFIKLYPNAEEFEIATQILEFINTAEKDISTEDVLAEIQGQEKFSKTQQEEEKEIYTYDPTSPYICVIAVQSEFVDVNRVKFNMINYNLDYFTNFNFSISTKELDNKYNLLFIETLSNSSQALNYYELINYSDEVFNGVEKTFTRHFVITKNNLDALLKSKNLDMYLDFFNENYLE